MRMPSLRTIVALATVALTSLGLWATAFSTEPATCDPSAPDLECSTSTQAYQSSSSVTVRNPDGTTKTYQRLGPGSAVNLNQSLASAPYIVYLRYGDPTPAEGLTGTGTAEGSCPYGQQLTYSNCVFSVNSGGVIGDKRQSMSYTRRSGTWYDGSIIAQCTGSGWTVSSADPKSCTTTTDPGTSCGGCTYSPTTGWRCTFCY